MQSLVLQFQKIQNFYKLFNKTGLNLEYVNSVDDSNLIDDYYDLVLVSDCPNNISDFVNTNGVIDDYLIDVTHVLNVPLTYDDSNSNRVDICLSEEKSINLSEMEYLKGVFLLSANDVVVAYQIFSDALPITNTIIFEEGLVFVRFEW